MTRKKLTQHFYLDEFLVSDIADEYGIADTPTNEHMENIESFLAPGLEKARALLGGRSIVVTSAYRNPKINQIAGGHAGLLPIPRALRRTSGWPALRLSRWRASLRQAASGSTS